MGWYILGLGIICLTIAEIVESICNAIIQTRKREDEED